MQAFPACCRFCRTNRHWRKENMGKLLDALALDMLCVESDIEKRTPEHKEVSKEADKYQEELGRRLKGEDKELFEKLMDLLAKDSAFYSAGRFTYGFRLGVRFTAESLLDMDEFIRGGNL